MREDRSPDSFPTREDLAPRPNLSPEQTTARLAPLMSEARLRRIEDVLDRRISSVVAVMDNLHDAQNLSAIARSCEGMGIAELHAIEASESFKLRRKVAQGSQKWIDLYRHTSSAACFQVLRARGFLLLGADVDAGSVPVGEVPVERPLALVFGAEHKGLRPETRALLDGYFHIPMSGFTRAFNASVAAAIALYHVTTRWRDVHQTGGDLREEQKAALRARFCRDSVRGARLVLALDGNSEALRVEKQRRLLQRKGL